MSLATQVLPPVLIQVAPSKGRPDFARTDLLSEAAAPTGSDRRVADEETVKKEITRQLPKPTMAPKPQAAAAAPKAPAQVPAQAKTTGWDKVKAAAGGAAREWSGAPQKGEKKPENPAKDSAEEPEAPEAEDGAAPAPVKKPRKATAALEEKPKMAARHDPSSHAVVDGPGGQKFTIQHGTHPAKLEAHPQYPGVFVDPTTGKHYAPAGHPIHQTGVFGMSQAGMPMGGMPHPGGGAPPPGGGGGGGMSWFNPGGTLAAHGAPAPAPAPAAHAAPASPATPAASGDGLMKTLTRGAFKGLDAFHAAQPQTPTAAHAAGAPGVAAPPKPTKAPTPNSPDYDVALADPEHPHHAAVNAHAARMAKPPEQPAPAAEPAHTPPAAPAAAKTPVSAPATKAEAPKVAEKPAAASAAKPALPKTPPPSAGADLAQRIGLPKGVEPKKAEAPAAKAAAVAKPEAKPEAATPKMPERPPARTGSSLADRLGMPKGVEAPEKAAEKPAAQSTEKKEPEADDKRPVRALLGLADSPAAEKKASRSALGAVLKKHGVDSPEVAAARDKFVAASAKEKDARPEPATAKAAGDEKMAAAKATAKAPDGTADVRKTGEPAEPRTAGPVPAAKAAEPEKKVDATGDQAAAPAKSLAARIREFHTPREEGAKLTKNERLDHSAAFKTLHTPEHDEALKAATGHAREKALRLARESAKNAHDEATSAGSSDADVENKVKQAYTARLDKWVAGQKTKKAPEGTPEQPAKAATMAATKAAGASVAKGAEPEKKKKEAQTASYNPPLDKMIQEWVR